MAMMSAERWLSRRRVRSSEASGTQAWPRLGAPKRRGPPQDVTTCTRLLNCVLASLRQLDRPGSRSRAETAARLDYRLTAAIPTLIHRKHRNTQSRLWHEQMPTSSSSACLRKVSPPVTRYSDPRILVPRPLFSPPPMPLPITRNACLTFRP